MKYYNLIVFAVFYCLFSGHPLSAQVQDSTENSAHTATLDEKFYNDYLDSLPEDKPVSKELLEKNIFRVLKKHIPRFDSDKGPDYVKDIPKKTLSYHRSSPDSIFVRGIFKEMPYLKPTEYMWIVQTGPYMIFVTFPADPYKFILDENQISCIVKKGEPKKH